MPGMINLQQYSGAAWSIARQGGSHRPALEAQAAQHPPGPDPAVLTVETPDGVYRMEADWVIACDGANSDTRKMLGRSSPGSFSRTASSSPT
jgi:3-(3-hydroxy-phenyl)propionate hydroxylase